MTLLHDSVPIPSKMDRYELRARELELEQQQRFVAEGSKESFWTNDFEKMQSFLIERYRRISNTYRGPS